MTIHKVFQNTDMEVPLLFLAPMRRITSLDEVHGHVIIFEGLGKSERDFFVFVSLDHSDLVMCCRRWEFGLCWRENLYGDGWAQGSVDFLHHCGRCKTHVLIPKVTEGSVADFNHGSFFGFNKVHGLILSCGLLNI